MSKSFGLPDPPEQEAAETPVSEQKEGKSAQNAPTTNAPNDAYDLTEFIAQKREGASTGARQKLEANEFNDETLLNEAGYGANGEAPGVETPEVEELETEPIEISDEWLEIFAWAGVELTDEAMPRLLQYLHAEDDYNRFKLPPNRRDKLKMAWIAFLRKVLPAWDDKQGLIAVIIMMYIENLVVGFWKAFGRVMSGTFQWPNFWPFNRFNKKKETDQETEPEQQDRPPSPEPQPPVSKDVEALQPEPMELAPTMAVVKDQPKAPLKFDLPERKTEQKAIEAPKQQTPEPKSETETHLAPEPQTMPGDQKQDPIDNMPFEVGTGVPAVSKYAKEPWTRTHTKADGKRCTYTIKADTFRTQKTMQSWLHRTGFYKNRQQD
jgi:hypothetical protein